MGKTDKKAGKKSKSSTVKMKKKISKKRRTSIVSDEKFREIAENGDAPLFEEKANGTGKRKENKTVPVKLNKRKYKDQGRFHDSNDSTPNLLGDECVKIAEERKLKKTSHEKKRNKVKKDKRRRKNAPVSVEEQEEGASGTNSDKVDEISGVDEDCSRGMRKWLIEYKEKRPGLKELQTRIDDFIAAHEVQEEQARKEREAATAEGGWTVVVHHKGRKKTTDAESGIIVGSIAEAAAKEKLAMKKSKELQDFYRFQKREAQRNEVMMLQSKFEQDKKRIQQLRAARKFQP